MAWTGLWSLLNILMGFHKVENIPPHLTALALWASFAIYNPSPSLTLVKVVEERGIDSVIRVKVRGDKQQTSIVLPTIHVLATPRSMAPSRAEIPVLTLPRDVHVAFMVTRSKGISV